MNDFRELKAPKETTKYEYTGWYVVAEAMPDKLETAWLATTGEVTTSTDNMPILFFDTELEALEESFKYYAKHRRAYPHAHGTVTIGTMEDDESHVMEFE